MLTSPILRGIESVSDELVTGTSRMSLREIEFCVVSEATGELFSVWLRALQVDSGVLLVLPELRDVGKCTGREGLMSSS